MAEINAENVLKIIFLILLIILSIGSNLVVISAILTYKKLRNAFNNLVVSLAVADLMVGALVIPFYLIFLTEETLHKNRSSYFYLYAVYLCFDIFTGISSIMNITLMSIDRALMLFSPALHARTLGNEKIMLKAICIPWVLALALVIPKVLQYHSVLERTPLVLVYFSFGFILPLIIIGASYAYIFMKHAKIQKSLHPEMKKDLKLAYMTFVIVIMFFGCWGPFFGVMLYFSYCNPCNKLSSLTVFSKWMQFFHSCCNPFIYALLQPSLRKAFLKILRRCIPCCSRKSRNTDEQFEMTEQEMPMSETTPASVSFNQC